MACRVMIFGCGRYEMADDQAGLLIAQRLRAHFAADAEAQASGLDVQIMESETPLTDLTRDEIAGVACLMVVDAARPLYRRSGKNEPTPGSWQRFRYGQDAMLRARGRHIDTHTLGVQQGLALAGALGLLPAQVWVYAIYGACFERGEPMSELVARNLPGVTQAVIKDVGTVVAGLPLPRSEPSCTN